MDVTTENIIEPIKKAVDLLKVGDKEKTQLAINLLMLIVDVIGAQKIADTIEDGVNGAVAYISELITGEDADLNNQERAEKLAVLRVKLDEIFAKTDAVQDAEAV